MWLVYALVGYLLLAIVLILDKKILSKERTKPVVFAFYSTIFVLVLGCAWLGNVSLLSTTFDWLVAMISGFSFGFGLWWMYKAVHEGEASHLDPFIGAVITITTFAIASIWLGENFTRQQILGISILALASLLLSLRRKHSHVRFEKGLWWAIIAGIAFAVSNVTAKYLYSMYPFMPAFVASRFSIGLFGLCLLPNRAVLQSFKKRPATKEKKSKGSLAYIVLDKILGIFGVVLIQGAIAKGSVTVVNAMSGLQYGFLFFLIIVLSKFRPGLFKEYFSRIEIVIQTIAMVLIFFGLAFVVM